MTALESSDLGLSKKAFKDYATWAVLEPKTLRKINRLIEDIQRNGVLEGIGNPERLKYEQEECYSRRIDLKNRLVYKIREDGSLFIISCKGHYDDN